MSDLRACAERIESVLIATTTASGTHVIIQKEVWESAQELARAVLSSLDVPADVREAMERLQIMNEKYSLADPYVETGISIGSSHHPYWKDCEKIADHFLANPIRIDVPDREQLLPSSIDGEYDLQQAIMSLLAVTVYNDNGYCSLCHGYWPNEHRTGCQGKRLKDILKSRPDVEPTGGGDE